MYFICFLFQRQYKDVDFTTSPPSPTGSPVTEPEPLETVEATEQSSGPLSLLKKELRPRVTLPDLPLPPPPPPPRPGRRHHF